VPVMRGIGASSFKRPPARLARASPAGDDLCLGRKALRRPEQAHFRQYPCPFRSRSVPTNRHVQCPVATFATFSGTRGMSSTEETRRVGARHSKRRPRHPLRPRPAQAPTHGKRPLGMPRPHCPGRMSQQQSWQSSGSSATKKGRARVGKSIIEIGPFASQWSGCHKTRRYCRAKPEHGPAHRDVPVRVAAGYRQAGQRWRRVIVTNTTTRDSTQPFAYASMHRFPNQASILTS
jgi:hypothetical protein